MVRRPIGAGSEGAIFAAMAVEPCSASVPTTACGFLLLPRVSLARSSVGVVGRRLRSAEKVGSVGAAGRAQPGAGAERPRSVIDRIVNTMKNSTIGTTAMVAEPEVSAW